MNELKVLQEALNLANQKGCFTLQDSAQIAHCLGVLTQRLQELQPKDAQKAPMKATK